LVRRAQWSGWVGSALKWPKVSRSASGRKVAAERREPDALERLQELRAQRLLRARRYELAEAEQGLSGGEDLEVSLRNAEDELEGPIREFEVD
jgi:hypothetical protein